jgi:hypothetical protein
LNLQITRRGGSHKRPVAKFLVPDWGDIVNPRPKSTISSGQGLASEAQFIVPYCGDIVNPMPEPGTMNLASGPVHQLERALSAVQIWSNRGTVEVKILLLLTYEVHIFNPSEITSLEPTTTVLVQRSLQEEISLTNRNRTISCSFQ